MFIKLVDSIGGGACQVTTTLSLLYMQNKITERLNTPWQCYVDLARDAAIAGTYKNLKFKNNTEYPIWYKDY